MKSETDISDILSLLMHGGKHACIYCDSTIHSLGTPRIIRNLKDYQEVYQNSSSDAKTMSQFGNVIRECLLIEDDNASIIESVPISELNHLWKVVTTLYDILSCWFFRKDIPSSGIIQYDRCQMIFEFHILVYWQLW